MSANVPAPEQSPATPSANDLGKVIKNRTARNSIYGAYVVALVIVGAVAAGFAVLDGPAPEWLGVTNAVLLYLGIPVGGLAMANNRKN